jgi:hypothetical protein
MKNSPRSQLEHTSTIELLLACLGFAIYLYINPTSLIRNLPLIMPCYGKHDYVLNSIQKDQLLHYVCWIPFTALVLFIMRRCSAQSKYKQSKLQENDIQYNAISISYIRVGMAYQLHNNCVHVSDIVLNIVDIRGLLFFSNESFLCKCTLIPQT